MSRELSNEETLRNVYSSFIEDESDFYDPVSSGGKYYSITFYAVMLSSIGFMEYQFNKDISLFRKFLDKSISIYKYAYFNYINGYPLRKGVSIDIYLLNSIFEALASGLVEPVKELMPYIGISRKMHEEELNGVLSQKLMSRLGYMLKGTLLGDYKLVEEFLDDYKELCLNDKSFMRFLGYALVLDAANKRDLKAAEFGLNQILKYHRRNSWYHDYGLYNSRKHCVWGIGVVNICRSFGMDLKSNHEAIPTELLLPINKEHS